jgi:hypothetical protein
MNQIKLSVALSAASYVATQTNELEGYGTEEMPYLIDHDPIYLLYDSVGQLCRTS